MNNLQSTDLSFLGEINRLTTIYFYPLPYLRFAVQPFLNDNKNTES